MADGLWFYSKEFDMTIREIEQAVTELSPRELARFRQWFDEFDAQVWDEQLENDANSAKLDKLANKAVTDYRAGKAKEL
jgi:hypothetical protein